jgi:hypothetical protein
MATWVSIMARSFCFPFSFFPPLPGLVWNTDYKNLFISPELFTFFLSIHIFANTNETFTVLKNMQHQYCTSIRVL